MALKDAGVPIKDLVAGVSIGLVTEGLPDGSKYSKTGRTGKSVLLVDLQGLEDHHGDMDFKIAGTAVGITAVQLDVKLPGISLDIVMNALPLAAAARAEILDIMENCLPNRIGPFSPRFGTIEVNKDLVVRMKQKAGQHVFGVAHCVLMKVWMWSSD